MPGERGDHCGPIRRVRACERANQADLRVSQRPAAFCYKICGLKSLTIHNDDFRRAEASLPQPAAITNGGRGPNFRDLS
jgi:hypothetical protein